MGFTQSADYIVEDVTNQWSSKSNRGNQNDFLNNMDMLDMGMDDGMHGDPMMNLGAIHDLEDKIDPVDLAVDAAVVATAGIYETIKTAHEGLGGLGSADGENGGEGEGGTDSGEKTTMREFGEGMGDFASGLVGRLAPDQFKDWYSDNSPVSYWVTVLGVASLLTGGKILTGLWNTPGDALKGGANFVEGAIDFTTAAPRALKKALD